MFVPVCARAKKNNFLSPESFVSFCETRGTGYPPEMYCHKGQGGKRVVAIASMAGA